MPDRLTILVVEDESQLAEMVVAHLQATVDADVIRTSTATETIHLDLEDPPDLMLVDILLPDGNGLDLIRLIRSTRTYPVLIMTGHPTMGRAIEALRLGVADVFTKPFDLQRLTCVVKELLAKQQTRRKEQRRAERLKQLVHTVIEERKSLQQRVDLVCRDLVGAYRDLAERFVQHSRLSTESRDFDTGAENQEVIP